MRTAAFVIALAAGISLTSSWAEDEIVEFSIKKASTNLSIDPTGETNSGVRYQVLQEGSGPKPRKKDQVRVHYVAMLKNGTVVDSSRLRGKPLLTRLKDTMKGWREALPLMPTGSLWMLHVPSKLAYGRKGAGSTIPPNADMFFEIELLEVLPP